LFEQKARFIAKHNGGAFISLLFEAPPALAATLAMAFPAPPGCEALAVNESGNRILSGKAAKSAKARLQEIETIPELATIQTPTQETAPKISTSADLSPEVVVPIVTELPPTELPATKLPGPETTIKDLSATPYETKTTLADEANALASEVEPEVEILQPSQISDEAPMVPGPVAPGPFTPTLYLETSFQVVSAFAQQDSQPKITTPELITEDEGAPLTSCQSECCQSDDIVAQGGMNDDQSDAF
jgi:hypothetical protein